LHRGLCRCIETRIGTKRWFQSSHTFPPGLANSSNSSGQMKGRQHNPQGSESLSQFWTSSRPTGSYARSVSVLVSVRFGILCSLLHSDAMDWIANTSRLQDSASSCA
jgi:hypothetical protein